jgi:integrase
MARLLAEQPASVEAMTELATRGETYAELAARVTLRRASNGVIDVDAEDSREKNWILKEIGPLEVTRIRAEHILSIYDNARTADKSLSTLRNIRAILRSRFAVAIEEDAIQTSPMDRVRVPKAKIDRRERAVLTDEELAVYLSWQHPEKHRQLAVLQRQTMSALARVFGGLRTGDLHALEWKHFNVPDFTLGDRAPE